ncbi:MAG: site-specific integrase, partial [Oscillospiraceae bacterium]|nr:site-specific integrase [Oscillospiraceae bacterium]
RDTEDKYIFEGKNKGRPCNPSHYRDKFKEALQGIPEVRVLTPHCCRHTYITHMLQLGVDPKTIQALVGHSEVDMTMYYAHAQETSKQAAIDRFNEAFSNRGGGLYGNVVPFVKSS